jgi:N-sulfoglucosamine sulfohydrolase
MQNLVLIDCHDLGRHLGAYGQTTVPSPNLDRLAAAGVRFSNSFCTAPQCSPSRSALYTGRYPHANGMLGLAHAPFNWRLHEEEVHLAALLRAAGYTTALAGIQHVAPLTADAVQELGFMQWLPAHSARDVADHVLGFLDDAPTEPFFLNIGFTEPHREGGGYPQAPSDRSRGVSVPPYLPQTPEAEAEFADLQGVIGAMDAAVGRIWAKLEEQGLMKNTWLIFTTDHGLAMPRAKCTLYDPGIETALIMLAPALGLHGGRVFEELISNVDLVPTIADTLHLSPPPDLQGQSFARLLVGEAYTPRLEVFAEKTFHTAYEPQRAIRTPRYKLIWNVEASIVNVPADVMHSPIYPQMIDEITQERPPFELYDLMLDPLEQDNCVGDSAYAAIFDDLRGRLVRWLRETGDPILDRPLASPYYVQSRKELFLKNVSQP